MSVFNGDKHHVTSRFPPLVETFLLGPGRARVMCVHLREKLAQEQQAEV